MDNTKSISIIVDYYTLDSLIDYIITLSRRVHE